MDDLLNDENGDILMRNGDGVRGDGDAQSLERLLKISPGTLKHSPLTGCAVIRLTNSRITIQEVERDIRIQLKADGWKNETISVNKQDIYINAKR